MLQIVHTGLMIGGGLFALLLVLLAMPRSKLREVLMPVVGWCFALCCGAYILAPIDLVPEIVAGPFGLVDDAGALVAGVMAASAAIKAGKARQLN